MTIGSLFSGIGGLELGLEWAGLGPTRWQVECDEYCTEVLEKNWPSAARFHDVKTVDPASLEPVSIICGGFPCQDISSAGSQAGLAGERSGLWREFFRIVEGSAPEWVVVENVASGVELWLDEVCRDLVGIGYKCLPVPIRATDIGAPHERSRVFVICRRHSNRHGEPMGSFDEKAPRVPKSASDVPDWSIIPGIPMADGISKKMAAIGNAVVPQCAMAIGYLIQGLR